MPDCHGNQLALKLHSEKPGLPVVFISGNSVGTIDTVIPHIEDVNFLQKPLSRDALAQLVSDQVQTVV